MPRAVMFLEMGQFNGDNGCRMECSSHQQEKPPWASRATFPLGFVSSPKCGNSIHGPQRHWCGFVSGRETYENTTSLQRIPPLRVGLASCLESRPPPAPKERQLRGAGQAALGARLRGAGGLRAGGRWAAKLARRRNVGRSKKIGLVHLLVLGSFFCVVV